MTAVAAPELEEPDDAPDVEELAVEPEPDVEELAVEPEPDVEELAVEPEPDDWVAVEPDLAAAAFARAGSLPVASCTKIPPELAKNNAVANATTRLRIALIRCLRAQSRSATKRLAPEPAGGRGIARRATGAGRTSLEGFTGVIDTSNLSWAECSTQIHRPVSQSRESRIRMIEGSARDLSSWGSTPAMVSESAAIATDPASASTASGGLQESAPRRIWRLRRSDCSAPGFRRVRRGRGFSYLDERGHPLTDEAVFARVRQLAIPPAWRDVWICSDPRGHLQATGTDAAGRKQYLYHASWRELRDREKFRLMLEFGARLPELRRRVGVDLGGGGGADRERVLAGAVRLLDVGLFRIGNAEYAADDGGLGLTTLHREHVSLHRGAAVFDFPAKSGVRWTRRVRDRASVELIATLKRRRGGPQELLAYRYARGWRAVPSGEINEYIKHCLGEEFSAKDFRTWNGTVIAAVALATARPAPPSSAARKRATAAATRVVAEMLGNTPAVARSSYIDPRVFDRYLSGSTIGRVSGTTDLLSGTGRRRRAVERDVLALLADHP